MVVKRPLSKWSSGLPTLLGGRHHAQLQKKTCQISIMSQRVLQAMGKKTHFHNMPHFLAITCGTYTSWQHWRAALSKLVLLVNAAYYPEAAEGESKREGGRQ